MIYFDQIKIVSLMLIQYNLFLSNTPVPRPHPTENQIIVPLD